MQRSLSQQQADKLNQIPLSGTCKFMSYSLRLSSQEAKIQNMSNEIIEGH